MISRTPQRGRLRRIRPIRSKGEPISKTLERLWLLLDVTAPILRRVEGLVRMHALRTLDAIHVGSCLEARAIADESLVFVTADMRQRHAAEAVDLRVVWVE